MLPGRFSLELYRGDTASWRFLLWADRAGTVPVNLTGATILAEIRDVPGGVLLTTMHTGIELPNVITMALNSTQTGLLPPKGAWDLQITFLDGTVLTPLAGGVTVAMDVSASAAALTTGDTVSVFSEGDAPALFPMPDAVPA